ncbi:hypothetical protein QTP81_04305 [Alteromonas sp. ASW11-36]|uniref:V-type ATP synthase subunit E n=1 Tax=Alteromonas arenosi TaxID=3055817 RepID=A0ABT7SUG0_9ALTE|nr:hypothetical protein [Alteromonas sp. ASW11-36]MDM7859821.1 hypothetical protein [Alteromonas sp. ASW11-36]
MSEPQQISQGVDQLIERLKNEGVAAGEQKANAIIADAEQQAKQIIAKAKQESQQRINKAREQAREFQSAAESALKIAVRDMMLGLKSDLTRELSEDLQRLVSEAMLKTEVLEQLIVEAAASSIKTAKAAKNIEVILPEKIIGLSELRNDPSALKTGPISELVFGLTQNRLREGVSFVVSEDLNAGIQIRLVDKDVTLDLSDSAVSELLLAHIQPRFRAMIEGVIR